ncbi:Sphingosine-1-phosphate transporter SPNS2 [Acropora cervicornis]|uniref:Sphingosine-1-phosphate transporter SPNS2 n=1 Tax=Acropora cervicornis TaxID=6130 RepID=A0AAD9QTA5_ACRCE|nr:Sphingosine-1-phosphate transporter SPNS2 [Acropora cervicornis]
MRLSFRFGWWWTFTLRQIVKTFQKAMAQSFMQVFKAGGYAVYVLLLLLGTYLLNQLDRYALAVSSQPMAHDIKFGDKGCLPYNSTFSKDYEKLCVNSLKDSSQPERNQTACEQKTKGKSSSQHVCVWDYDGTGSQYQILAGPVFILVYTVSGIPLGFCAGVFNRKNLLVFCLLLWSAMTLLTGFATKYWHLVITRFILGIGEAGCTPFASSLIADYFPETLRGSALGVYNWGIYIGYSMAYAFGNFITEANIEGKGWRWVFWIAAMPGFVLGALMLLTLKEPARVEKGDTVTLGFNRRELLKEKFVLLLRTFMRPSLIILFVAGSIRNAGGYVWAYNTQPYFNKYYPSTNVGEYMSWIPLVGGSLGVVLGGFISDRLIKNRGFYARVWVLVFSQVIAAPFAAGALFLKPPYAFISLIPSNVIGEMWVGVTLTVVVELVPNMIRSPAIAGYLFVISIIGGNMPLLVPPLKKITSLRTALYILFPGLYLLSSVLFLLTLFSLKRDLRRVEAEQDVIKPLLPETPNSDPSGKTV